MQKKSSCFSHYTFDYPNRDPDKISIYAVGWICIILLGLCVMFADIPAGILLIVFSGLILTEVMLWKNPDVFKITKIKKIPWIIAAYMLTYTPTLAFAYVYWLYGQLLSLIACIISAFLISMLLFYILYRWQKRTSAEESIQQLEIRQGEFEKSTGDSLERIQAKTEQSVTSLLALQEQFAKSTEDLKQKIQPDARYAELDKWATIPDSVNLILETLVEDGFRTRKQVDRISRDTIRINLQNRLRNHAEMRHALNANFYKTIDIATEAAKEFPELQTAALLAEINRIASPGNALKRAKK